VTWLLVEDDLDIRTVVTVMMRVWGVQPLVFPDGNSTWAWLDSVENGSYTGELPELALMDIKMPGPFGDQIAARIRQTQALKHIPIILMTAFTLTGSEVTDLAERSGMDHLIFKPLPDFEDFRRLMYEVRNRKHATGAE
jgi:CheY-like chemotaxis protein